jgi:hypothetical protein
MSTIEAARAVSRALGVSLSTRDVDAVTRAWPVDQLPPLERGRRRWGAEHIERLRAAVEARAAKAAG